MKDLVAVLLLCAMTAVLTVLVSPSFEVALDDSWNFALPTKHFLETGVPVFDPFNSAAAVLHIVWGGLFCTLFGFSFTVCRISNIIMALIATLGLYYAARQSGADQKTSGTVAAAFAANPVLMVTSYTYQSDIVYLAMAFFAAGFYLRYLRTFKHRDLLIATVIASLSVWNKMHGILLPIGALIYFLIANKKLGLRGIQWVTVTAIPAMSFFLFKAFKPVIHPVSTTLDGKMEEFTSRITDPAIWAVDGGWRFYFMIVALGLYCLPLFAGWLVFKRDDKDPSPWVQWGIFIAWAAVLRYGLYLLGLQNEAEYPFHSSVLRELPPYPRNQVFDLLTTLSWGAGAWLGLNLTLAAWRGLKEKGQSLLLFGLFVPQMLILVPIKLFMDRYFLVLIGFCFLILVRRFAHARFIPWLAAPLIVLSFVGGAARIDQYKQGNVAQWEGAKRLVEAQVSPLSIDAGYAWTGWNNYEHSLAHPDTNLSRPEDNWYIRELNRTTDVRYVVDFFEPPQGNILIEKIPYTYWFADEPDFIYIYRRPYADPVELP